MTSSKPARKFTTPRGPIMAPVENSSSLLDRVSAASSTDEIQESSRNSSGDGIGGTSAISPPVLYGDPDTAGCVEHVPSSRVHPRACASTAIEKGMRTVANPKRSDGCRARRTIRSASKFASGQRHPQASICSTVPVCVNSAGGGSSRLSPFMASMISSFVFMDDGLSNRRISVSRTAVCSPTARSKCYFLRRTIRLT